MFSSLPLIETEILLTGGCHGGAVADMASSNVGQKKSKFPHACLKIFRASRNSNPVFILFVFYIYITYTFNQIQIPLDNLFWYQYTVDGLAIWGLSFGMMEFFNSTIICCFACRDPEDWQLYSPWRFGNCRGSGWVENKPKQHQIAEAHEELLGAKNWAGREKASKHIKTHCL